jgi:site-specific DNA recombinase
MPVPSVNNTRAPPAEQARIVQLLVERVDVQEDALEVRVRTEGLASLVGELRQDERRAA